jgi:hypothetical protein
MFERFQRLHSRGPANRGIAVDADGALLGPDCVLVRRTADGYRCLDRADAAVVQDLLFTGQPSDWLFGQCRRIAAALDGGDTALAQILGLHMPIGELDDARLRQLALAALWLKANFNPDQPRIPAGNGPESGEWIYGDDEASPAAARREPGPGEYRTGDPDRFFDTVYDEFRALAERLGIDETWLLGLAAHESGYLDEHNRELNDPFGVTHRGRSNVQYESIKSAVAYWERRFGSVVQGATSTEDFVNRLFLTNYNTADPKWSAKVLGVIRSIARHLSAWQARRGRI